MQENHRDYLDRLDQLRGIKEELGQMEETVRVRCLVAAVNLTLQKFEDLTYKEICETISDLRNRMFELRAA